MSQNWSRIAELVDEGLALTPTARAVWLDTLSRSEPTLARAVRKLIEARVSETETMASPVLAASPGAHFPGNRVGPYLLVELLGSGGMSDVYAARDRARELRENPAWITGIEHRIETPILGARDLTTSPSTQASAKAAGRS